MNILHVTAQKPSSTGSGVYLTQLSRSIAKAMSLSSAENASSFRQGVLAGIYEEDTSALLASLNGLELYQIGRAHV